MKFEVTAAKMSMLFLWVVTVYGLIVNAIVLKEHSAFIFRAENGVSCSLMYSVSEYY